MPDLSRSIDQLRQNSPLWQRPIVSTPQGPRLEVDGSECLSFCGSDYLGLASEPRIAEIMARTAAHYGVGTGASAWMSGHLHLHERLEQALARFLETEAALLFSSSQIAHLSVVPALVGKGDAVFCDEFNQATLHDGARLSGARVETYSHGDMTHLEFALASSSAPCKLIVSEAVFPGQGDLAPMAKLVALCERHDAWLVLDDSHGFGIHGTQGRGTLSRVGLRSPNLIQVVSLGNAAGGSGAAVVGSAQLVRWLMQGARGYHDSGTISPPVVAGLIVALQMIESEDARRQHIDTLSRALREALADSGWRLMPSESAIHSLLAGDRNAAIALTGELRKEGIWVPVMGTPSVPRTAAQLRISLTSRHTMADVERLVQVLRSCRRASIAA